MKELRCYQRIEDVNKMYYIDEEDARRCYDAGTEVLDYIKYNDIKLDTQVMFKFIGNVIQMAVECNEINKADELVVVAGDYVATDWNFVSLSWRESSIKFKKGEIENSYNLYKITIDEYIRLHDEFPTYQVNITRNNMYAIKKEIGEQFKDEYYITEAVKDAISLYNNKIISFNSLKDTYEIFTRLNSDLENMRVIKSMLTLNKIAI